MKGRADSFHGDLWDWGAARGAVAPEIFSGAGTIF